MSAYFTCYRHALSQYRAAVRRGDFGLADVYSGRVAHWRAMILSADRTEAV